MNNKEFGKQLELRTKKKCESEASETVYWLEIINELKWIDSEKINLVLSEANEMLGLFTSIGKN